jgi:hypothetical protein
MAEITDYVASDFPMQSMGIQAGHVSGFKAVAVFRYQLNPRQRTFGKQCLGERWMASMAKPEDCPLTTNAIRQKRICTEKHEN